MTDDVSCFHYVNVVKIVDKSNLRLVICILNVYCGPRREDVITR